MQPIHLDVAAELAAYLKGKPAGEVVRGGPRARGAARARVLRIDLDAAGTASAVDGPEHADFHALRHSYLTLGGRSGIDLRTLQEVAGPSTSKLTEWYTHRRPHDLAGAVDKMPSIIPARGHRPPV